MSLFDQVVIVDWSAGKRAAAPKADAIWIGYSDRADTLFCPSRQEAEAYLTEMIAEAIENERRLLIGFDFPFGYPKGFVRQVTGSDDPFSLWDWLEARIEDQPDGANNRFDVAEALNGMFQGPGPFWGKPREDLWPNVPYRKAGIFFDVVAERRACDVVAKASSSCFQLYFPPTVGGQVLMGLPVLSRLKKQFGSALAVWPFEPWKSAQIVLGEVWPGLIEGRVREAMTGDKSGQYRDQVQVSLLAQAFGQLSSDDLAGLLDDAPDIAQEEAWILGAGHADVLAPKPTLTPPPLRDDCYAMPAGVEWTPVDAVLSYLKEAYDAVTNTERVGIYQAAGCILAQDVVAQRSSPPAANSAVDGYGVAGPIADGPHVWPLVDGRAAAGVPFEGNVPPGTAIRILTGAQLPNGVDTVLLQEDVNAEPGRIAFQGPLKRGRNTRPAGEDVTRDATIVAAKTVLRPPDLALCASVGVDVVSVRKPLRVGVLSTGDELCEVGATPRPGQIMDANRPMLLSLLADWGYTAVDLRRVKDDPSALRARLDEAKATCDAVLTSGGASAGDEDHVSALLKETGALRQWRIAVKPGRPLAVGDWSGMAVFGLPGNPVAALICTLIFAAPALRVMAGGVWKHPTGFMLPAAFSKSKKPGRREYLRARVRDGAVEVFRSEGSGRISGLSWAEGLVELPDGALVIEPGTPVQYYPYEAFRP